MWCTFSVTLLSALSALTPLVGWQEGHPACKNWVLGCWRGCLQRGADLHMAQLMPLLLNVSCFSKIQVGFTFLILAHPGSPRQRAVEWVCVCVVSAVMTQEVSENSFTCKVHMNMHMAQMMPLPLTISCLSKIQIRFTFLILAQPWLVVHHWNV